MVPPALSIPLGTSGSSVDVVKEENGTFSINGETITAETRVTAENGNVYRALLSPEGLPIGVDHVAAMQDVMLGSLGGTITLTQSEDKSWMLGDITVTDGYVHTAANGNMYALMMDADGMWSGTYQEVMVTVALGTQGSVTLTRSEDMSWWLGSEAVMNGSMVNSANGNEYMLSMSDDGAWTAMFQPVSMAIEGTGLTAMTREGDDKYDVGDATLAASGTGNVTVDGAMYRVWMMDDGLAGARYDDKQKDGRYNIGGIGNPALSVQDDAGLLAAQGYDTDEVKTTVANELQTHLKIRGEYFSIGTLLETGQASRVGDNQSTIVSSALGELQTLRQKAVATLDVFPDAADAGSLRTALENIWEDAQDEVDLIFGKDGATSNVSLGSAENDDDILDDFDDVIAALSDVATFQDATKSGGGGVFAAAKLSADDAAAAFDAEKKEATATFGAVGNTRFGAFWRKIRADATSKLDDPAAKDLGAFAYGTTKAPKTLRTRYVRQGTGSALYQGETNVVDGKGNFFSGNIEIQVRFAAEKVNAVITNLTGADGGWEYLYDNTDVEEIFLPDTDLGNAASWSETSGTGATVTYATRAGLPRPVTASYTFRGQLLGRDEGNQGNEAVGVWSLGASDAGENYLAGGFGAIRGDDLPDIRPPTDSGTGAKTKVLPYGDILKKPADAANVQPGEDPYHGTDNADTRGQTIAGGMLTVIGQQYDKSGVAITDDSTTTDKNEAKYRTHEIDIAGALDAGATAWANGNKYVDQARTALEKQLRILESDIGLSDTTKQTAWDAVRDTIVDKLFGLVPVAAQTTTAGTDLTAAQRRVIALGTLPGLFGTATYSASRNREFVDAVKEALEALESNDNLKAALAVKGIFHRTAQSVEIGLVADDNDATNNVKVGVLAGTNGKDASGDVNLFDKRNSRVQYLAGSTDFTRFGAWRRQTSPNANAVYEDRLDSAEGDGPNAFAYSQLETPKYTTPTGGGLDPRFPAGARMTYEGSAVGVLGAIFIAGEIDVEVLWNSDSLGGMANMSISEIENVANGARLYVDLDTSANDYQTAENKTDNALQELVAIDINNLDISAMMGLSLDDGDTSNVMLKSVTSGAVGVTSTTLHGSIDADNAARAANVMGDFVGPGVSGPLAVLGTYRLHSHAGTIGFGEMLEGGTATAATLTVTGADADGADGTGTDPVVLHGAFGAEAP